MIRFASLGSGSAGNGLLVDDGTTCLLVDCGFSLRETARRLLRLGLTAEQLDGILVTHEHTDHVSGVFGLARRHALPVWLSRGTYAACEQAAGDVDCRLVDSSAPFAVGALRIEPFQVPHDAREPLQYVFSDGKTRLGLLTDTGEINPGMRQMLDGCDGLVLECNHDADMLAGSSYPAFLKRRIAGRLGHLDNRAAVALLASIDTSCLRYLVAAHLSASNNCPETVCALLAKALGDTPERVVVACQQRGFDWLILP